MGYAGPAIKNCPQCNEYTENDTIWPHLKRPHCPSCGRDVPCGFKPKAKWQLCFPGKEVIGMADHCVCGYVGTLVLL